MRERACGCDGANENCPYCFGKGYVQEGIPWTGGGTGGINFVPANKAKSVEILREAKILSAGARRGRRRNNQAIKSTARGRSRVAVGRPSVASASLKAGRSLRRCPMCKALVKTRKLPRHLSMKCPKNRELKIKLLLSLKAGHSSTATIRREIPESVGNSKDKKRKVYDQVSGRDRVDFTKDYAHNFRERGRFGSHPSHDGFDDESGPE